MRFVRWKDLEIRQAHRGIRVFVRMTGFGGWWNDAATWKGDPMGGLRDDWPVDEDEDEE